MNPLHLTLNGSGTYTYQGKDCRIFFVSADTYHGFVIPESVYRSCNPERDILADTCGWIVLKKDVASVEQSLNTLLSILLISNGHLSRRIANCRIRKPYDEAWLLSVHGNCRSHRFL